jgi:hypothetical protein
VEGGRAAWRFKWDGAAPYAESIVLCVASLAIMSDAERANATENGHESDETENAKLLGQLDACVQLMQRGSLLLVFHTQVCFMPCFF